MSDKKNILYYFNGQASECHFFCMFSDICSYLFDEDKNVFLSWSNNKFDNSGVNVLDYLFEQNYPEKFDYVEYGPNNNFKKYVKYFFDSKPSQREGVADKFCKLFYKTFKPNVKLDILVNNIYDNFKNYKTLAVHIRRSDILKLNYFSPFISFDPNDMEKYYEKINNIFTNGGYQKIFICTEDEKILDFIENKYEKGVVIKNNVYRGFYDRIDNTVTQENMYTLNRENNGEKLLLEIMSDVFIATKCDGFLGTPFSGVSIYIELLNNNKFKEINYF